MSVTVSGTSEGDETSIFDNDPTTFWTSEEKAEGISAGDPYLSIDLGGTYIVDRFDYTKRFHNAAANIWKCTGNLRSYVLEISNDNGTTWTKVKEGNTFDDENLTEKGNGGTTEISFDPVEATNIRISGTASYHWQDENSNKFMTVADVKIFGEEPVAENLAKDKAVSGKWADSEEELPVNSSKPLSNMVDGNKAIDSYTDFGEDDKDASAYVQIDLGEVNNIEALNLYRYWQDKRTYKGTVIMLSEEAEFTNPVIVYNSDKENFHKLGAGMDETYVETADGKAITLDQPVNARYARIYMHGSSVGNTNHIVELEVMGRKSGNIPVEEPTDLTALIQKLSELTSMSTSNATINSVEAFQSVIKEGYDLLSGNVDKATIEAMIAKLENAKTLLVDTTGLKDAIKAAQDIADTKTTSSSQGLLDKIEEAKALLIDGTKETINEKMMELKDAQTSDSLEDRGDTSALSDLITSYSDLKESDYTKASWNTYQNALTSANAVVEDNSDSNQAKINEIKAALEKAYGGLEKAVVVPEVDKTALRAEIAKADAIIEDDVTVSSYQEMKNQYERAVEFESSKTVSQEQVNEAASDLATAVSNLKARADVSKANALLDEITKENLAGADYTQDTWTVFDKALNALKAAVNDNSDVNDDQMQVLIKTVEDTKAELVKVVIVDKTALKELYDANKDKPNDNYTEESWTEFRKALETAKAILTYDDATVEQVKTAEKSLKDAIQGLTQKDTPDTPEDPEEPDQPVIPDEPEEPDQPVTPDEPNHGGNVQEPGDSQNQGQNNQNAVNPDTGDHTSTSSFLILFMLGAVGTLLFVGKMKKKKMNS